MTEKKKNIPELRFPEFDEEWKDNLFGSFYEFMQTYSFARNDLNYETGEIKNIHYGDIHTKFNNNFIAEKEDLPFINHEKIPSKIDENNFCRIGDLVIADASEDYNDVGKTIEIRSLGGNKILAGLHTFLARPIKNKIAIGFMGYYLQTSYLKLQRMKLATGISVLGISKSNLKKVRINLPSNPEQQKIASFLTSVDERIQQLTKKKELLEKYKKGIMQKIFSQELRFKDDDGNDFPDWEEKRVLDLFRVTRGNVLPMNELSSLPTNEKIFPVYSSQTLRNGLAGYYSNYLFENAITWTTDGANAGDTKYRNGRFYCTNVCGVLISNEGYANNFIAELLNSITRKYVSYVGNPKLMNNVMAQIRITIPSKILEQQKIADFLSSIDKKIESVATQLEKTKEFKKGLLQKMFV